MSTGTNWSSLALLLVRLVTTSGFAVSGLTKLAGAEVPAIEFAIWGYPGWLLYVVGAMELGGALALWHPRWARTGLAMLAAVVLGAAATHVNFQEWSALQRPAAFGALLGYLALRGRR